MFVVNVSNVNVILRIVVYSIQTHYYFSCINCNCTFDRSLRLSLSFLNFFFEWECYLCPAILLNCSYCFLVVLRMSVLSNLAGSHFSGSVEIVWTCMSLCWPIDIYFRREGALLYCLCCLLYGLFRLINEAFQRKKLGLSTCQLIYFRLNLFYNVKHLALIIACLVSALWLSPI